MGDHFQQGGRTPVMPMIPLQEAGVLDDSNIPPKNMDNGVRGGQEFGHVLFFLEITPFQNLLANNMI